MAYSWSQLTNLKGMPYGGMPADSILVKLEETDPAALAAIGAARGFGGPAEGFSGYDYKDYQIGEMLDRTLEQPFLASDSAHRDPSRSRSKLNLQYNGTRGGSGVLPRHPELFLGFTGNDPRGADNTPRFDKMRSQMEHRARNLEVHMGGNVGHDGHQEAERPWTGPAIQRARVELQEQVRARTKIFSTSEDGRPTGRNLVTNDLSIPLVRRDTMAGGNETFVGNTGTRTDASAASIGGHRSQNAHRAHQLNRESDGALRRVAANSGTADFSTGRQGMARRQRQRPGEEHRGRTTDSGQILATAIASAPLKSQSKALARAMRQEMRQEKVAKTRSSKTQDASLGVSTATATRHGHDSQAGKDSIKAYMKIVQSHSTAPGAEQATRSRAVNPKVGEDVEAARRRGQGMISLAASMAAMMRKAGRDISGTDTTLALYKSQIAPRAIPLSEREQRSLAAGLRPSHGVAHGGNNDARQSTDAIPRAALSAGAATQKSQTNSTQQRPEYRGSTQVSDRIVTGAADEETFGLDAAPAPTGGLRMGTKSARSDKFGEAHDTDNLVEAIMG